jgi:hypothetical protein
MSESVGLRKTGGKIYRSSGAVAQRYGKCVRTIDRWLQDTDLKFPPPDLVINGKRLWSDGTLDQFDAKQKAATRLRSGGAEDRPTP